MDEEQKTPEKCGQKGCNPSAMIYVDKPIVFCRECGLKLECCGKDTNQAVKFWNKMVAE